MVSPIVGDLGTAGTICPKHSLHGVSMSPPSIGNCPRWLIAGTVTCDVRGRSMTLPDNKLAQYVPAVPSSPLSSGEAEVLPCLFSFRAEDAKASQCLMSFVRDFKDRLFWVWMEFGFGDVLAVNEVVVGQLDESHANYLGNLGISCGPKSLSIFRLLITKGAETALYRNSKMTAVLDSSEAVFAGFRPRTRLENFGAEFHSTSRTMGRVGLNNPLGWIP